MALANPPQFLPTMFEPTIIQMAALGDVDGLRQEIEVSGVDVDTKGQNGDGATALAHAVAHGHGAAVTYLLTQGADIEARSTFDDIPNLTPFLIAARMQNAEMLKLLANNKACVNVVGGDDSIEDQDSYEAVDLVDEGTAAHNTLNAINRLIKLAKKGKANPKNRNSLAEQMLECTIRGASVHQQFEELDNTNSSMLHLAVDSKNLAAIEALDTLEANMEVKNCQEITPIMLAIIKNDLLAVQKLREKGAKFYYETKQDGGIPLTDNSRQQNTCLMLALENDDEDFSLTRYLIEECGLDVKDINNRGWSVLSLAALTGNLRFIQYLFEQCPQKPDLNLINGQGHSILRLAVSGNANSPEKLKVVKYLLQLGANIETSDFEFLDDLDEELLISERRLIALIRTNEDLLEYARGDGEGNLHEIMSAGASIHVRGVEGDIVGVQALHLAVLRGDVDEEVVSELLKYGADPNAQDENGLSPMDYLLREQRKDKAKLLAMCLLNPIRVAKQKVDRNMGNSSSNNGNGSVSHSNNGGNAGNSSNSDKGRVSKNSHTENKREKDSGMSLNTQESKSDFDSQGLGSNDVAEKQAAFERVIHETIQQVYVLLGNIQEPDYQMALTYHLGTILRDLLPLTYLAEDVFAKNAFNRGNGTEGSVMRSLGSNDFHGKMHVDLAEMSLAGVTRATNPDPNSDTLDGDETKHGRELNLNQALHHLLQARFKPIVDDPLSEAQRFEARVTRDFFDLGLGGDPMIDRLPTPQGVLNLAKDHKKLRKDHDQLRRKSVDLTDQIRQLSDEKRKLEEKLAEERMARARLEAGNALSATPTNSSSSRGISLGGSPTKPHHGLGFAQGLDLSYSLDEDSMKANASSSFKEGGVLSIIQDEVSPMEVDGGASKEKGQHRSKA